MKQVTFEEAKGALNELALQSDKEFTFQDEINGLKRTVEDFINQFITPTWEEVVKAWENVYGNRKGLEFNTEHPLRIEVNQNMTPAFNPVIRLAVVDLNSDYIEQGNTSIAYHKAINLTIRYLEEKEEN